MIKTRFAPSPTGYLHIGGARTALFAWLYARKNNGKFVLRIEDTDAERSEEKFVSGILAGLTWLGVDWDEGPIHQSDRVERYQEIAEELLEQGKAYRCSCSKERLEALRNEQIAKGQKPKYDGHCRSKDSVNDGPYVIRFMNDKEGDVSFNDKVRGTISVSNKELDDVILIRSDGLPTYNFSVIIDDHDLGINHVIRGDDHVSNTPRQINILKALGWPVPEYIHVPMILGEDGKRLSKRHQAVDVLSYKEMGILPDALINYLVRLGWSHGDQEIFSREEMISLFGFEHIHHSAATFNSAKLQWLNQHYIKSSPEQNLTKHLSEHIEKQNINIQNGPSLASAVELLKERAATLVELTDELRDYYKEEVEIDAELKQRHFTSEIKQPLIDLQELLQGLDSWNKEEIKQRFTQVLKAYDLKFPMLGIPLRVAVLGKTQSPAIDATLSLLGKEKVISRLSKAIQQI